MHALGCSAAISAGKCAATDHSPFDLSQSRVDCQASKCWSMQGVTLPQIPKTIMPRSQHFHVAVCFVNTKSGSCCDVEHAVSSGVCFSRVPSATVSPGCGACARRNGTCAGGLQVCGGIRSVGGHEAGARGTERQGPGALRPHLGRCGLCFLQGHHTPVHHRPHRRPGTLDASHPSFLPSGLVIVVDCCAC